MATKPTGTLTKILEATFKLIPKEILIPYLIGVVTDWDVNSIKNPNTPLAKVLIPALQGLKDSLNTAKYLN